MKRCLTVSPLTVAIAIALASAACQSGSGGATGSPTPTPSATATPTATPPAIPTRYFLVSAGGSMTKAFGATTEFQAATQSVDSAAALWSTSGQVGLTIYGGSGGTCPNTVDIAPALSNSTPIGGAVGAASPAGFSTAAAGVDAARTAVVNSGVDLPTSRIIFIFDGNAADCAGTSDDAATITAVQTAFTAGIAVSIINVDSAASAPFLQQLANAGAGLSPTGATNAPYDTATTPQALASAVTALGP